jgi:hypothetical protein
LVLELFEQISYFFSLIGIVIKNDGLTLAFSATFYYFIRLVVEVGFCFADLISRAATARLFCFWVTL